MGRHITFAVVVTLVACGGGKKDDTTPDEDTSDEGGGGGMSTDDGADPGMCPPEKLDAIKVALDRKRNAATRCLTDAIDAGEADKNARGMITVGFVIETNGHPRDVSVQEASLDSKMVQDCVVDVVAKMTFPELPSDLDWSYTFAFEAY
jgi:hypothetical protein